MITWVKFGPETDGVDALYINGFLYKYGDYYHTKLSEQIAGWFDCMRWHGKGDELEQYTVSNKYCTDIIEMGEPVPEQWPDGNLSKFAKHIKGHEVL